MTSPELDQLRVLIREIQTERDDLLKAVAKCGQIAASNVSQHQREITDAIAAVAQAAIAKVARS